MRRFLALALTPLLFLIPGDRTVLDPSLPPNIARYINDLERRIRNLENAAQLTNSSIKDGTLEVLDGSGNVRVRIGRQLDTTYGVQVFDTSGALVWRSETTTTAYVAPSAATASVTSGSFVSVAEYRAPFQFPTVLRGAFDVTVPGGSTAQLALYDASGIGSYVWTSAVLSTTGTVELPAGTAPDGTGDGWTKLQLHALRASGAGTITVNPRPLGMA